MFSYVFSPGGLTIPSAIKAASLKWLPLWENSGEDIHSRYGRVEGTSSCLWCSVDGHVLWMTSSNTPPLVTGSYNVTCLHFRNVPLRGQHGFSQHGSGSFGLSLVALETDTTATVQAYASNNRLRQWFPKQVIIFPLSPKIRTTDLLSLLG